MARGNHDASRFELVQPVHSGAACWPALEPDTGSLLMLQADPAAADGFDLISRSYVGTERSRVVYDWMCARPADWPVWGRAATLFGEAAIRSLVVASAERENEEALLAAERVRLEIEEETRLRRQIDLFILDDKGRRPGLSLESGNACKPFFVMRFSEKWERERVLDWLRWQRPRFAAFRDLFETEGGTSLERAIIAGMRETEREVKMRGLASGGRRPLRFWRGE